MTSALVRTLEFDTDKVRCTTCGFPWAEHPHSSDEGYFCIVLPGIRPAKWIQDVVVGYTGVR